MTVEDSQEESVDNEKDVVFEGQLFPYKGVIAKIGKTMPAYEWAHNHEVILHCLGAIPGKDYTYIDLLTLATNDLLVREIVEFNHMYYHTDIKPYLFSSQKSMPNIKRKLGKS